MRKASKLLLSTALLATFAGGVVVPVVGTLGGPTVVYAVDSVKDVPENTDVVIHKLQADQFNTDVIEKNGIENKDGEILTQDALNKLGTNVTGLDGVIFRWYKIPKEDTSTAEQLRKMSETELDAKYTEHGELGPTANGGQVQWTVPNPKGNGETSRYWIIEHDTSGIGDGKSISSSVAVPFEMTFPVSASDGSGYLKNVNVYPKNTVGNIPKPGKDVGTLGNNTSSYNIGQVIPFILKGSIPKNIQDYEKYNFVDTFDARLTPLTDADNVKVQFGTTVMTRGTGEGAEATGDYTVAVDNGKVTVALTKSGIDKIAKAVAIEKRDTVTLDGKGEVTENTDTNPFIQVTINAKINEKAQLATDIDNQVKIDFDNTPGTNDQIREGKESGKVIVFTGGKKFKKVDATTKEALAGAEFTLLDANKIEVKWTDELLKANDAAIKAGKFVDAGVGKDIVLKSSESEEKDVKGTFEISGLAYGSETIKEKDGTQVTSQTAENKVYFLRETKAPKGYVVPVDPIKFEISKDSGTGEATAIQGTAEDINNNTRPSIPQTGGIGSAIFILAGLGSMLFAGLGLKKRKNQA